VHQKFGEDREAAKEHLLSFLDHVVGDHKKCMHGRLKDDKAMLMKVNKNIKIKKKNLKIFS